MPVPTPQEIHDALMTDLLGGIESASVGDQSVKLMDPAKRLAAVAQVTAVAGGLSGWGGVLRARAVLPSAGQQGEEEE